MEYVRHGAGCVRPYLFGKLDLPQFVCDVFGAEELERGEMGGGAHVELKLGDSMLVIEAGALDPAAGRGPGSVYVYVPDVDAVYRRAIDHGATSLSAPADKPYDERGAGVVDSSGNTWWLSTYKAPKSPAASQP